MEKQVLVSGDNSLSIQISKSTHKDECQNILSVGHVLVIGINDADTDKDVYSFMSVSQAKEFIGQLQELIAELERRSAQ